MPVRLGKKILTVLIPIFLILSLVFPHISFGEQTETVSKMEETLEQITDDERAVIEELFILSQEIEGMLREEIQIGREIELLQEEINQLEGLIEERQKKYDHDLEILKNILVSYQRRGPATFVETLLNSKNLKDFIKNVNIIRELAHNTGDLLNSLEEEKMRLAEEKEILKENRNRLNARRQELQTAIENKMRLKNEQEAYLASLKEKRQYFEEQLRSMELVWEDLKELFPRVIEEYTMIVSQGYFTIEDFNIKIGLTSIKGAIYDDKINAVLEEHSKLPKLKFDFSPGVARVEIPEKRLKLAGTFTIAEGKALKFEPGEGTFCDLYLEPASLRELFREGYLLIDFTDFIGDFNIRSVEIKDGYIEFEVSFL